MEPILFYCLIVGLQVFAWFDFVGLYDSGFQAVTSCMDICGKLIN